MTKQRAVARSDNLSVIASILASGIVRKRLRNVRNYLKKNGNTEIDLEVSPGQSLYPVEPQRRRKK